MTWQCAQTARRLDSSLVPPSATATTWWACWLGRRRQISQTGRKRRSWALMRRQDRLSYGRPIYKHSPFLYSLLNLLRMHVACEMCESVRSSPWALGCNWIPQTISSHPMLYLVPFLNSLTDTCSQACETVFDSADSLTGYPYCPVISQNAVAPGVPWSLHPAP